MPGDFLDGTLLHYVYDNDAMATRLLLQAGAAVDATDSMGVTPLMVATSKGFNLVVEELISSGASIHAKDDEGRSAVQYALDAEKRDIFELFLRPTPQAAVTEGPEQT